MNYVKKMCILRQIKQGFSGDGKALSGLIKVEQYGKNLAVEVSIINFAPLALGEYYCLLSDGKGKTEMLSLRGKSLFNILSDLDVSSGFCGIVCYVKTEVVPIAYGINGNGSYNWRAILNKAMPPVFPKGEGVDGVVVTASVPSLSIEKEDSRDELNEKTEEKTAYNDEAVATENYFEEKTNERVQSTQAVENADTQSPDKDQSATAGSDTSENGDATGVRTAFNDRPDGYYLSVKRELDELFKRYPQDSTLCGAFSRSEWVRLRGSKEAPEYLVGAVYEEGKVRYVCYALAAEDKNNPPEEIQGVCAFVPTSALVDSKGFFVIFQSAATGECIKPPRG